MTSRRILIIDDDDDIREVVKLSLETTAGWEVMTAASGREGLETAGAERPDAILLDVSMPEMDGPATLQKLRQNALTRDIPIIFLTAKVQATDQRRLGDLGVAMLIPKPFDPMQLATQVGEVLGWND